MDINQEADILKSKDIKQIKLSLIKSFTKSVQTIGQAMEMQHIEKADRPDIKRRSTH